MKKTLTDVTIDCLLAFFLNSSEQADKVLRANFDKVSVKNRRVLEQVLERSQSQKNTYWLAIAEEVGRQVLMVGGITAEPVNRRPLSLAVRPGVNHG